MFCWIVVKNHTKENEYIIYFFEEYIEKFKSYRNIKLCTQIVTLRFCKIVVNYKNVLKMLKFIYI
jgi:hypothetical protein